MTITECEYRGHNWACRRCGEWPPGDRRDTRIQELEARVRELETRIQDAEEMAADALERERGAGARVRATLLAPFGVADYKVWTDAQYRGDDALVSDPPATEVEK